MAESDEDAKYKAFCEARKDFAQERNKHSNLREKYIITLASSSLAVSVVFIDKVVQPQHAIWIWALYISWLLFATVLIVTVASYHFSEISYTSLIEQIDRLYGEKKDIREAKTRYVRLLTAINFISPVLYVLATLLLVLFVVANIDNKRHNTEGIKFIVDGREEGEKLIGVITIFQGGSNMTDVTMHLEKGRPKPPPPPPPPRPGGSERKSSRDVAPPLSPPPPPPKKQ